MTRKEYAELLNRIQFAVAVLADAEEVYGVVGSDEALDELASAEDVLDALNEELKAEDLRFSVE